MSKGKKSVSRDKTNGKENDLIKGLDLHGDVLVSDPILAEGLPDDLDTTKEDAEELEPEEEELSDPIAEGWTE